MISNFQAVDLSKYDYEIYMVERSFFNMLHLFVALVLEHKKKRVFEYIRPDGLYWEILNKKKVKGKNKGKNRDLHSILTTEKHSIPMEVVIDGVTEERVTYPVPLYGYQSPRKTHFGHSGGACPSKGRYVSVDIRGERENRCGWKW